MERNRKHKIFTYYLPNSPKRSNKKLQVIIDDSEIDTILEMGSTSFGDRMFLFRRLNGEKAIIPIKVAYIKYPDAVMDFYEKAMMIL